MNLNSELVPKPTCPFCDPGLHTRMIAENPMAFAVYDKFPVSSGHCLVIPLRHIQDYFELSTKERRDCWDLVNLVKEKLDREYHPDGYNIGINNMTAAGQTIPHVHIHVIPRYTGDVERPEGGVRGVIPERKEYKEK